MGWRNLFYVPMETIHSEHWTATLGKVVKLQASDQIFQIIEVERYSTGNMGNKVKKCAIQVL